MNTGRRKSKTRLSDPSQTRFSAPGRSLGSAPQLVQQPSLPAEAWVHSNQQIVPDAEGRDLPSADYNPVHSHLHPADEFVYDDEEHENGLDEAGQTLLGADVEGYDHHDYTGNAGSHLYIPSNTQDSSESEQHYETAQVSGGQQITIPILDAKGTGTAVHNSQIHARQIICSVKKFIDIQIFFLLKIFLFEYPILISLVI